ncbi:hypothetical protein HDU76_014010 [Blyttiomyces sp. JEL0837]|nr:hypothetical protein HDU76_014010 [Blyttiomyces sp. JEL0837]
MSGLAVAQALEQLTAVAANKSLVPTIKNVVTLAADFANVLEQSSDNHLVMESATANLSKPYNFCSDADVQESESCSGKTARSGKTAQRSMAYLSTFISKLLTSAFAH